MVSDGWWLNGPSVSVCVRTAIEPQQGAGVPLCLTYASDT
jgi:hypothetical protein